MTVNLRDGFLIRFGLQAFAIALEGALKTLHREGAAPYGLPSWHSSLAESRVAFLPNPKNKSKTLYFAFHPHIFRSILFLVGPDLSLLHRGLNQ